MKGGWAALGILLVLVPLFATSGQVRTGHLPGLHGCLKCPACFAPTTSALVPPALGHARTFTPAHLSHLASQGPCRPLRFASTHHTPEPRRPLSQLICRAFDLLPSSAPRSYPALGAAAGGRVGRRAVLLFCFLELAGASIVLLMVCWQMLELLLPSEGEHGAGLGARAGRR